MDIVVWVVLPVLLTIILHTARQLLLLLAANNNYGCCLYRLMERLNHTQYKIRESVIRKSLCK